VQAFGGMCCSNETRAPVANPSNSAQLEGTIYYSPNLLKGPCSSVRMRRGTERYTDTHRRPWPIYAFGLGHVSREM